MNVCIVFAEDPEKNIEPFGFNVHSVWTTEEGALVVTESLHKKGIIAYYEIHEVLTNDQKD